MNFTALIQRFKQSLREKSNENSPSVQLPALQSSSEKHTMQQKQEEKLVMPNEQQLIADVKAVLATLKQAQQEYVVLKTEEAKALLTYRCNCCGARRQDICGNGVYYGNPSR